MSEKKDAERLASFSGINTVTPLVVDEEPPTPPPQCDEQTQVPDFPKMTMAEDTVTEWYWSTEYVKHKLHWILFGHNCYPVYEGLLYSFFVITCYGEFLYFVFSEADVVTNLPTWVNHRLYGFVLDVYGFPIFEDVSGGGESDILWCVFCVRSSYKWRHCLVNAYRMDRWNQGGV